MENTKYTKEYFIKKFEAIPEDKWCKTELTSPLDDECHCALGHCGIKDYDNVMTPEAKALVNILDPIHKKVISYPCMGDYAVVYEINDGADKLGSTPKERILKALSMVEDTKEATE